MSERFREQAWPWPLHVVALFFAGFAGFMTSLDGSQAEKLASGLVMFGFVGAVVWNLAVRRTVELDATGFAVSGTRYAWSDVASPHFREAPLARAGMFLRFTPEARARLRLPPPAHRAYGPGLHPAPTALADVRYDLFLRARGDQLATWYTLVGRWLGRYDEDAVENSRDLQQLREVRAIGEQLVAIQEKLVALTSVTVAVVSDDPTGITLELRAMSIEALFEHAKAAIGKALPDDAKWNPQFARGVMVLVGPLELAKHPRNDEALAHVKAAVESSLAGKPRAIAAIYAAR